jgi:DNA-binding transcriptional LysR family regulator
VIAVMGERLAGLMNTNAAAARLNIVLVREALAANIGHTIQVVDCVVSQPSSRFRIPEMRSTPLFRDRWVCVAGADNTRFGEDVADLDELMDATWVVPCHDARHHDDLGHRWFRGLVVRAAEDQTITSWAGSVRAPAAR